MKTLDIIKSANQNLLRNKLRSMLTILAIFIGSFTIILSTAVNAGVTDFIDGQIESVGGDGYLDVAPAAMIAQMEAMTSTEPQEYDAEENSSSATLISKKQLAEMAEIHGVTEVSPFSPIEAEYITSGETDKKFKVDVQGMGTEKINLDIAEGRSPNADRENAPLELVLLPKFAVALGFESDTAAVGQEMTLAVKNRATGAITNVTAEIVGIQAPSIVSMGRTWLSPTLHAKILNIMNQGVPAEIADVVMAAGVEFDPELTSEEDVKKALEEIDLMGISVADEIGMVKTFLDVILIVFSIFGGIALLAASIGIINTLFMSVQERTREIGLDKALGMGAGKIFLSFAIEAISLGFWGSLLGTGLSMIIGTIANAAFHAPGGFLVDFPTFDIVVFTPANCIIITLIIMLIAFLAGTLPALKAARKNPIDALRYE